MVSENMYSKLPLPWRLLSTKTQFRLDSGGRYIWTWYRRGPSVAWWTTSLEHQSDVEDSVSSDRHRWTVTPSPAAPTLLCDVPDCGACTHADAVKQVRSSSTQTGESWLALAESLCDWSSERLLTR